MDPRGFFGERAESYRVSKSHGNEADLARMLDLVEAPARSRVLDVATGGGHTALAFARAGHRVVATDLTRAMLDAVGRSAEEQALALARVAAEAGAFPFREASFDVVASRIAPHHFPSLDAFVRESARVLRPGGALYVFDLGSPEDLEAARVIDRIERLRDPSHGWSHPASAWRRALQAAGLAVERLDETASEFELEPWLARAKMDKEKEAEARRLLREHPAERLHGYGLTPGGRMRVLRVELVARRGAAQV